MHFRRSQKLSKSIDLGSLYAGITRRCPLRRSGVHSPEVILWSAEWEWTLDWTQGEGEVQAELFICFLEGDSNWKDTNLFRETIQEDQPTEFHRKLWEFGELGERHFGERLDQNVEGLLRLCDRRIVRRMRSQDERGARIDSGARR